MLSYIIVNMFQLKISHIRIRFFLLLPIILIGGIVMVPRISISSEGFLPGYIPGSGVLSPRGFSGGVIIPACGESYDAYPSYPDYPTYPSYPDYPTYPSYPDYNTYPSYPDYNTYPSYPDYPTYPDYNTYPSYPSYPDYPAYDSYDSYDSYPDYPSYGASPTISSNPKLISAGGTCVLTWSAQGAVNCVATANPMTSQWQGSISASGSKNVTPSKSTTYTITCNTGTASAICAVGTIEEVAP